MQNGQLNLSTEEQMNLLGKQTEKNASSEIKKKCICILFAPCNILSQDLIKLNYINTGKDLGFKPSLILLVQ
jgi:hypothetical protein